MSTRPDLDPSCRVEYLMHIFDTALAHNFGGVGICTRVEQIRQIFIPPFHHVDVSGQMIPMICMIYKGSARLLRTCSPSGQIRYIPHFMIYISQGRYILYTPISWSTYLRPDTYIHPHFMFYIRISGQIHMYTPISCSTYVSQGRYIRTPPFRDLHISGRYIYHTS